MKLASVKKSVRNVVEGAWVGDLPIQGLEGVNLKVRGTHNPSANIVRDEEIAKLSEERRAAFSDEDRDAVALEVMARAILIDWDLVDDDDASIPCTEDARRELMTDPDIGETIRRAVAYASAVVSQRGRAALEADVKN